jgi:IclR family acetate operon transcriptional repressor
MGEDRGPVESVDRALSIVELLGDAGAGLSLGFLAERTGLPKSTLHRSLSALRRRGFVMQQRDTGLYLLGPDFLRVAFTFYERLDVRTVARPLLSALRDEFDETAHVGILDGADVVYLDKIETRRPIALNSEIGGRNPAHCTGIGKALLAWTYASDQALQAWAKEYEPLAKRTRHSITSVAKLRRELREIRERGYAVDAEENQPGVRCVGVPLFIGSSVPKAAVSIAAPGSRLSDAQMGQIAGRARALMDELLGVAADDAGIAT